jgi:hypothetical protein
MRSFKHLIAILWLASCSFKSVPPPAQTGGTQAAFVLSPVSAVQVETIDVDPASGLANHKVYHVKVCVVDRASKQPVINQDFNLARGETRTPLEPSDAFGCLYWTEEVRFSARVKNQVFITYPRQLESQGVTVDIPIALNPWIDGSNGLADLRSVHLAIAPVPAGQAGIALAGEGLLQGPSHSFQTDGSRGQFNGVVSYDPRTSATTIGFTAEVRVVDPADRGKALPGEVFEYLVSHSPNWPAGAQGTVATSNSAGDVPVQGQLDYLDLSKDPERYERRFILIRSRQIEGETRSVEIAVNPHQRGELFYRDLRRQGTPAYEPSGVARLKLQNYNAFFLRRGFELNEHLQLTTLRDWNLTLKPTLARPNPSGKVEPQLLQPGTRFKMSLVLVDPMVDASHQATGAFLAAYESEVQIDDQNQINTPITLAMDFTQQPRLDSRTQLQITLTPVSSQAGLVDPLQFSAPFVSNPNGNDHSSGESIDSDPRMPGHWVKIPLERTRAIAMANGTAHTLKVDWGDSPLALFEKYWQGYGPLTSVALDDAPTGWGDWKTWTANDNRWDALAGFVQSDGQGLTAKADALLLPFCDPKSGLGAEQVALCRKRPTDYFQLNHFTITEKVLNTAPQVNSTNNYFGALAVSFFNEHAQTDRTVAADKDSEHFIAGVGTKLGYGMLGNESTVNTAFNKEREWYRIKEVAAGDGQRSRVSSVDTITLSKEEITVQMHLQVRTCALIIPQRFILEISQKAGAPIKSLLACSAPQERRSVKESWFSIRDRWNAVHSALTDPKDPRERGWTKMVRGTKAFAAFERVIRDKTRNYYFEKVDAFIDGVDNFVSPAFDPAQEARLARDGGIFPGVLRLEESTPVLWSEAQIRHYVGEYVTGVESKIGGNSAALEKASRFAFCLYETAARRWDYVDFTHNVAKRRSELQSDGTQARCMQFAQAGGAL